MGGATASAISSFYCKHIASTVSMGIIVRGHIVGVWLEGRRTEDANIYLLDANGSRIKVHLHFLKMA